MLSCWYQFLLSEQQWWILDIVAVESSAWVEVDVLNLSLIVPLCGFAWLCVPLCGLACSMIKRLKRFRQLCKRNPHTPDLVNGWLGDIVDQGQSKHL